ncbi:hypothetical protein FPOAC2_07616 [Fusarium poae]
MDLNNIYQRFSGSRLRKRCFGSNNLCKRCSRINLDKLACFYGEPREKTICKIDETTDDSWISPFCPLCQLFESIADPLSSSPKELNNERSIILRNPKFIGNITGNTGSQASLLALKRMQRVNGYSTYYPVTDQSLSVQSGPTWPIKILNPQMIDFDTIRGWLSCCLSNHEQPCSLTSYPKVDGLRLIDVRTGKLEPAQSSTRYVALSYVWGKPKKDVGPSPPPSKCETKASQEDSNVLPHDIPETVEDAMIVTAALGFRFLWVDRYCVPQAEINAEDRHCQIKQMDKIYSGADLTIIAAAGEGPQYGLPGVKKTPRKRQRHGCFGKHTLVSTMTSPGLLIQGTSWYSRAWTYQEAIFSRRRLLFTDEQVFFECQKMSCRETVDYMWPLNEYAIFQEAYITAIQGGIDPVLNHIIKYTRRQLTYDSDALNAILGVLRLYSAMKNPVFHFWGVPMSPRYFHGQNDPSGGSYCALQITFLRSLCWIPIGTGHRRSGFPTWSWAGWSCTVRYNFRISAQERVPVTVSIGHTDGSFKILEDTFHQSIKPNTLQDLSKTLRLRAKAIILRTKILCAKSSDYGKQMRELVLFAWPLHQDETYGDVQYMIPVQLILPLDARSVALWTKQPPQLHGVFMERDEDETVPDRLFVLIFAEVEGSKFERVGHLELEKGFGISADIRGPRSVSTGRRHKLGTEDCVLRRKKWETESEIREIDII